MEILGAGAATGFLRGMANRPPSSSPAGLMGLCNGLGAVPRRSARPVFFSPVLTVGRASGSVCAGELGAKGAIGGGV